MSYSISIAFGLTLLSLAAGRQLFGASPPPLRLEDPLRTYVEKRVAEFGMVSEQRQKQLERVTDYVQRQTKAGRPARLTFICTHNSRRSQLSQVWAALAAAYCGVQGVETFSGGTERTAFNPRAVAALERAGFRIEKAAESANPHYMVRFDEGTEPLVCFSKVFDEAPNPSDQFCAVMTCAEADSNCPLVAGAAQRVPVPFDDPKASDGTPQESAVYDERCAQIACEMLYIFSQVKLPR